MGVGMKGDPMMDERRLQTVMSGKWARLYGGVRRFPVLTPNEPGRLQSLHQPGPSPTRRPRIFLTTAKTSRGAQTRKLENNYGSGATLHKSH